MSNHFIDSLVFRPASELPTIDMAGSKVLVLNPYDGYHIGRIIIWNHKNKKVGIYPWIGDEFTPHDFYIAWALLPDEIDMINFFEKEKHERN